MPPAVDACDAKIELRLAQRPDTPAKTQTFGGQATRHGVRQIDRDVAGEEAARLQQTLAEPAAERFRTHAVELPLLSRHWLQRCNQCERQDEFFR